MATRKLVAVRGSKKAALHGAKIIAPAPADERLEVTVRLRPRNPFPDPAKMCECADTPQKIMTHAEYEKNYGADPKDVASIRKFATAHGLSVVRESLARRSVMLSGTVASMAQAFGVKLDIYEYPGGTYRGRVGQVRVPAELSPIVEGVFGLDNRRVAKPHFRVQRAAATHAGAARPFNPNEVAKLYNFPDDVDGSGQCIGIIELGGGYRPQDLSSYFKSLGIKAPTVIPVSVDGAANAPTGDPDGDDGEVVLDIEVAGAVAPGAKIVVYFAPNDRASKGFLDAITKAVHDTTNNPSVISISWGGPEEISSQSDAFQTQFDQALQAAAMLGITVCVAAGDNGAADEGPNVWDGSAHADFPSASPFALACGGTRMIANSSSITEESIWNQHKAETDAGPDGSFGSSGGGVSGAFDLPAYQKNAGVPKSLNPKGATGRGLPDVTGAGDPATGYNVFVDGTKSQVGGTSAVAPLWAGLIALINQKLHGRVGFINPQLYALSKSAGALNDITAGDNRVSFGGSTNVGYDAGPGWDACSGLGSPNGKVLAGLLTVGQTSPAPAAAAARAKKKTQKKTAATKNPRATRRVKVTQSAKKTRR
jgi:kumamolisin